MVCGESVDMGVCVAGDGSGCRMFERVALCVRVCVLCGDVWVICFWAVVKFKDILDRIVNGQNDILAKISVRCFF